MYAIGDDEWPGISKLIEECGEVIQVCGKLLATHGEAAHWDGTNLHRRLADELGDLQAAIRFVQLKNPNLDPEAIRSRADEKLELFLRWHRGAS